MIIRCTRKLLKEMGIKKANLYEGEEDKSILGEWYANLFFIRRKKCIIFVNARTMFSFASFDVKRPEIKNLGELFRSGLGRALLEEDIKGPLIRDIINQSSEIHFVKTNNRIVTGIMVEYIWQLKWMIEYEDAWDISDLSAMAKKLNSTPLLTQKFHCAEEELKRVLEEVPHIT